MNKQFVKQEIWDDKILNYYTEEFSPSEIEMKYFDYEGNDANPGDEVRLYAFEAKIPGIHQKKIRKITFPEMNYLNCGIAKVLVEYVDYSDSEIEEIEKAFQGKFSPN